MNRKIIILLLGLLSAVGPLSIDMYLPAFGTIAKDFGTSTDRVQLSLTSFFIGIAVGQLIYGPLLDKFGRKKPLLIGLGLYALTSILCVFVYHIDQLIALRFLQALGSCAGMVASRAMVRDYYDNREAARVFSLLMLVIAISPILAPSLGAFILQHFDWHVIFVVLFVIALLILLGALFFLPESFAGDRSLSLKPRAILSSFSEVLRNRTFIIYCLIGSISSAGLYAYLAGSSYVIQEYYKLSKVEYGIAFAFVASAMILATQINRWLLKRWNSQQISRVANMYIAAVGSVMMGVLLYGNIQLSTLLTLIFLYFLGLGFVFPNTSALALSPFKALAGSASALLGCIQMGLGALSSALVSILHDNSSTPMLAVMCACAVAALCIQVFFAKNISVEA